MARRGENIYKRKDGRWEGRCIIGHGKNGRAAFRSLYGHSYKEVKEKLLMPNTILPSLLKRFGEAKRRMQSSV